MRFAIALIMAAGVFFACDSASQTSDSSKKGTSAFDSSAVPSELREATFAGGCFWCVEAVFERVQGVEDAISGYAGGKEAHPTYEEVSYGKTTHAEAVRVLFDPQIVSYETLLEVFFAAHDPTQLNRQGPDVGKQYRSAVFYHDDSQREAAQAYIGKLSGSRKYSDPIVTLVEKAGPFYVAEDYHQNYYELNPNQPYVQRVSRPKVEKFEKEYPQLLKPKYQTQSYKSEKD